MESKTCGYIRVSTKEQNEARQVAPWPNMEYPGNIFSLIIRVEKILNVLPGGG